jgi:chitinase
VVQDTNRHDKKTGARTCTGGLQSFCCKGFKPASSSSDLKDEAEDAAKAAAEGVSEQTILDIAAKAFCRIAVPALLAPLEALEALIPHLWYVWEICQLSVECGSANQVSCR